MPDATDLNLEEWRAVTGALREKIANDKFPFSDRIRVLKSALAKLDPVVSAKPTKAPPPPLPGSPMVGSRRKPRRSS